ncbi:hypothetical protein OSB04_002514, partial [Centaurea solstitialis]
MSSSTQSSSSSQSLAFRVMRLCRPTFHVETPLRFDLSDLIIGEDLFDDPTAAPHLRRLLQSQSTAIDSSTDLTYSNRFLLRDDDPSDAMGLPGMLVLPQAFGYISITTASSFEAEIQTERQRILLLDTTKTPVETIRAGGRYDFIVEHDVKELGAHTLVCTALYSDGDAERKYLPQYFKFNVSNPLSVRTKVRVVKETTYLEACLENNTKSNLYMDQVDFEPTPQWSATLLKADDHHSEKGALAREVFKPPILIRSGGGIHNYLYQLKSSSDGSVATSNVLGKLQITWRTNLGEPGRLQTQQIIGNPITHKEVELKAMQVPSVIILEKPFTVHLSLTNLTEKNLGPFEVSLSLTDDNQEEKAVMVNGLKRVDLPQVEAFASLDFKLNLIAMELGMQKISGITVFNTIEKKSYDPLPDVE